MPPHPAPLGDLRESLDFAPKHSFPKNETTTRGGTERKFGRSSRSNSRRMANFGFNPFFAVELSQHRRRRADTSQEAELTIRRRLWLSPDNEVDRTSCGRDSLQTRGDILGHHLHVRAQRSQADMKVSKRDRTTAEFELVDRDIANRQRFLAAREGFQHRRGASTVSDVHFQDRTDR